MSFPETQPTADYDFWSALDHLIAESKVVVDRPKASCHPKFHEMVYPLDYGYLEGTVGGDGAGVDVWLGSVDGGLSGVFVTVDPYKKDVEVKLVLRCCDADVAAIVEFYAHQPQKYKYISREG